MERIGWLYVIVGSILASIYAGWVLTCVWGWFVVTAFQLPALSLPVAMGIMLVVGHLVLLSRPFESADKNDLMNALATLCFSIAYRTLTLFAGWIVYHFI